MTRTEVQKLLQEDILKTDIESKVATDVFNAAMNNVSIGLSKADGTDRIRNASIEYAAATSRLAFAMKRHDDFLIDGVVPTTVQDA